MKSGNLPANASLADIKMDKEAVNLLPGIKNRIRLQNPGTVEISGVLVQIGGADNYHDVKVETNESSDTLSVFYIDIDPDKLSLPINTQIVIAPTNPNGDVIDIFKRELHIDTPFKLEKAKSKNSASCELPINKNMNWIYTLSGGVFENAPGYWEPSSYQTMGCCYNGVSSRCTDPNTSVTVDNQFAVIVQEGIRFSDNGKYSYVLELAFNDFDPKNTDYCSLTATYSYRSAKLTMEGNYSREPLGRFGRINSITIQDADFDLEDAYSFIPLTQPNADASSRRYFLGCRYYIERINLEGPPLTRVFEVEPEGGPGWYD